MAAHFAHLTRLTGRWDVLVLASAIWFLAKFLRYAFPPLFPTFHVEFGVSNAVLGSVFSAMMLVYAGMQFPSGALADRVGPVRVIAGGAVLAALGALLVFGAGGFVVGGVTVGGITVGGFAVLVAAMLLVGLGTGAHKTVSVMLLPAVYTRNTGRALGALDTFGTFGGVAAPAVVVALAGTAAGWPALFLGGGVAGLALAALFATRVPGRLPDDPDLDDDATEFDDSEMADDPASTAGTATDDAGFARYVTLFAEPRFRTFVAVTVLFAFAYNGVAAFLPLYLTDVTGLSAASASLAYSGLFAVSLVQPLTGEASDRVGRFPVIAVTLAIAVVGLLGLLVSRTALAAVLAVLVFGVGSHGFRPVRAAHLYALVPGAVAGGSLGVVRTAIMVAAAVSPAVVGVVSELAGFRVAFGVLGVSLLAALVLVGLLFLARDRGE